MHTIDFLVDNFPFIQPKDSISDALLILKSENSISDIPVLKGKDFFGIIKGKQILSHSKNFNKNMTINELDIEYFKTQVTERQHIFSLLKIAYQNDIQTLPVFNKDNIFIGIVRIPDIFEHIGHSYAMQQEGGIIVLKMKQIEYSLSLISQIVENEKKQILATWVSEADEIGYMFISIKLDSLHLENIISCFEKNGYEICSAYPYVRDESKYESILKFLDF